MQNSTIMESLHWKLNENLIIQEEPETLGEVTGNKGKSRGSDSLLGVLAGDGCK